MTFARFPGLDGGSSSSSSRLRTNVGRRKSGFGVDAGTEPAGRWIVDMTETVAEKHVNYEGDCEGSKCTLKEQRCTTNMTVRGTVGK